MVTRSTTPFRLFHCRWAAAREQLAAKGFAQAVERRLILGDGDGEFACGHDHCAARLFSAAMALSTHRNYETAARQPARKPWPPDVPVQLPSAVKKSLKGGGRSGDMKAYTYELGAAEKVRRPDPG